MMKKLNAAVVLQDAGFVSYTPQAFLRNNTRVAGLKQTSLIAIAMLSLMLSSASIAGTCTISNLTGSTQCLDDVSKNVGAGNGGNVTLEMMNSYANGAGAFGQQWILVDKIESYPTDKSDYFSFDETENSRDWKLNDSPDDSFSFESGFAYAFVLKGGRDSATYFMDTSISEGVWNDGGLGGGLSNITLYRAPSVVPLPAAVWLFGSALIGIAGIGTRRRVRRG